MFTSLKWKIEAARPAEIVGTSLKSVVKSINLTYRLTLKNLYFLIKCGLGVV